MSAFQALGPFISTFANPNMTGLYFDQDGILRVQPHNTEVKPPMPASIIGDKSEEESSKR